MSELFCARTVGNGADRDGNGFCERRTHFHHGDFAHQDGEPICHSCRRHICIVRGMVGNSLSRDDGTVIPVDSVSALTMPEFWQLRGIVEAHGEAGACKILGISNSDLVRVMWPGTDEKINERVRAALQQRKVRK